MSAVYPSAVTAMMTGAVDLDNDTVMAQLTVGYTYAAAHDTLADVGAGLRLDSPVAVTVTAVTDGEATIDPITFPAVTAGSTVDGVVFYVSSGGEASPLICHVDRSLDRTPLAIATNGGDIVLTFPRWLKL